jgi:phosphohistidine phosphatase
MEIYLVRHGDALSASEDTQRPLSPAGRGQVAEVARLARDRAVQVATIYHSGILRAQQTAEILAESLAPPLGIAFISGLLPEDDPAIGRAYVESTEQPVMLVGHLPYMRRLAALLVHGDPERTAADFGPADMLCCTKEGRQWRIHWQLKPPQP